MLVRASADRPAGRRYGGRVPRLILINGAPGSGKSTLARRLVEATHLSLLLEIDTIRGHLGRWADDPAASGVAARRLAIAAAGVHLDAGHDVVVPQFLGRVAFIEQLERAAAEHGSEFIEIALVSSAEDASRRFQARHASVDQNHADARLLQSLPGADSIETMYERMLAMLGTRPHVRYVRTVDGAIDATFEALLSALT